MNNNKNITRQIDPYIRRVHDFPKPGICFYDVTTLFQEPVAFDCALTALAEHINTLNVTKIVGIEARGFILGSALADRLRLGFVLARKPGKLPYKKITEDYTLEYGAGKLELHSDSITKGERVVIVDDLIATGGTVSATCKLVERLGGVIAGITCMVALSFLPFSKALDGYKIDYLISYDSEKETSTSSR